jgi:formamidopyrimidine-DNA glycosylase
MLEVETYRQQAEAVVGRRIVAVDTPDAWYLKRGISPNLVRSALVGRRVEAARRVGKLLILDLDDGGRLGLRFGMTGRLLVDGSASIRQLEYSSARNEPRWERFGLRFEDGGTLTVRDPRRLGGVELDPPESRLGPDAATLTVVALTGALAGSSAPLKARLMNQARVAGIGNLLADEILWRARVHPRRAARDLSDGERRRLYDRMRSVLDASVRAGRVPPRRGWLTGVRDDRDSRCPRCGTPLSQGRVGGRGTVWCSQCQPQ